MTAESDKNHEPHCYHFGDMTLDMGTVRVERDGRKISLPRLSYQLLECLLRRAPNAVSIDELIEYVWDGVIVNQETVTQRVRLLRDAIDGDSQNPKFIETIRGLGYRLMRNRAG